MSTRSFYRFSSPRPCQLGSLSAELRVGDSLAARIGVQLEEPFVGRDGGGDVAPREVHLA
jgi:hypothetical protein